MSIVKIAEDQQGKSCVLVVDDDEGVRRLLVRELSQDFDLIVASGYSEAMSVFRNSGRTLAAMVTDYDLGSSRTAIDVLEGTRLERVRCARVVVSGEMDDDLEARLAADDLADAALPKPWPPQAVAAVLAGLLDRIAEVTVYGYGCGGPTPRRRDARRCRDTALAKLQAPFRLPSRRHDQRAFRALCGFRRQDACK